MKYYFIVKPDNAVQGGIMENETNECAVITKDYIALMGGPAIAETLTQVVRPHKVVSQSVYAWGSGRNDPNPYMLHFIFTRTANGTPEHEWARRCLLSQGFGAWIGEGE
jgi:hypothetical protein